MLYVLVFPWQPEGQTCNTYRCVCVHAQVCIYVCTMRWIRGCIELGLLVCVCDVQVVLISDSDVAVVMMKGEIIVGKRV